MRMIKKLLYTILVIVALIATLFPMSSVEAIDEPIPDTSKEITEEQIIKEAALDEYTTSELTKVSDIQYAVDFLGTKSRIEIGSVDKENIEFKPDLTIKHWDNEVSFSLIASVSIDSKSELTADMYSDFVTDKVVASNGEWQFEYYAVQPTLGFNEYGGIDIIITAKEKPASNKIYFTYDSKTVTPYYQGELTPEEIKEGASRPEHVVGSIAFYADGKANHALGGVNYATGKVGHLYAMRAGAEWARWSIEGEYIVLTIPDAVYNGKYPVVIRPVGDTFGYTSIGASTFSEGLADYVVATGKTYTPSAGTTSSMSVYSNYNFSGSGKGIKLAIYDNTTLIGNTITGSIANTGFAWYSGSLSVGVSATGYYLAWLKEYYLSLMYDTITDGIKFQSQAYSSGFPNPVSWSTSSSTKREYSVYCTYTPSGGDPDISNTPSSYNFTTVSASTNYSTGLSAFNVTNNSGFAINVLVYATNFTGGNGWALSDTAVAGSDIAGLMVGLDGQSYNVTVKGEGSTPYNVMVYNLADSAVQGWGIQLICPTEFSDGAWKSANLTLSASAP